MQKVDLRYLVTGCVLSVIYLLLSFVFIGFKTDQLILAGVFTVLLPFPSTRRFILAFTPFIIFWILFDFMKAFPNYLFNEVHIKDLHDAELTLFGISMGDHFITPGEFLSIHHFPAADILAGIFYLCWVPVPLIFAIFLFMRDRTQCIHFTLTFLLVNCIGFIIYYTFPAAPPWYVNLYGFDFHPMTAGNIAGLIEFDRFVKVPIFEGLYTKSSNVFAAMPSLHAAYPITVLYFSFKNNLGWITIVFAIITIGIWVAAVYTNHHYILDILAGILTAIAGIGLFQKGLASANPFRRFIERFARLVS